MIKAKSIIMLISFWIVSSSAFAVDYDRKVYFKSSEKDRIYVLQADSLDEREAKKKALSLTHTPGKMTAVYVYGPNKRAPGNHLNTLNGVFEVNNLLYDSQDIDAWDYVLMRNRNGQNTWTNCNTNPGDVCRY